MEKMVQADGSSDSTVRKCLAEYGPPFLFGADLSDGEIKVGDCFELAGQPFVVVRMCDEAEFREYQRSRGVPHGSSADVFVEAVTD